MVLLMVSNLIIFFSFYKSNRVSYWRFHIKLFWDKLEIKILKQNKLGNIIKIFIFYFEKSEIIPRKFFSVISSHFSLNLKLFSYANWKIRIIKQIFSNLHPNNFPNPFRLAGSVNKISLVHSTLLCIKFAISKGQWKIKNMTMCFLVFGIFFQRQNCPSQLLRSTK